MILHKDNIIKKGLYTVGWISRGPSGVIGTNKHDGAKVAQHIYKNIKESDKLGRKELKKLLIEKSIDYISKEDWMLINNEEINRATETSTRSKFTSNKAISEFLLNSK